MALAIFVQQQYRELRTLELTRRPPATIARKLAAFAVYHRRSLDHPTPTDHDVVRAVVRARAANWLWRNPGRHISARGHFALRKLGVAKKTTPEIWNAVLAACAAKP
jgi:hypothetical protein